MRTMTDLTARISNFDELLHPDNISKTNLAIEMVKDDFCFFMELNGFKVDKTPMPAKSKTVKVENDQYSMIFQRVEIGKKTYFNILIIYYFKGPVLSHCFNYDGTLYETEYRKNDQFSIIKKTVLTRLNDGTIYYRYGIGKNYDKKCYMDSFLEENGVITRVMYMLKDDVYELNVLLNAMGKPNKESIKVEDYLTLVDLFSDDDALVLEMALC